MNDLPPQPPPPEDLDELYRRASALDPSRPGEHVRRAVLAHAETLTQAKPLAAAPARPQHRRARWHPVVFGTLAAAVLAGLVIAPHWLRLRSPAAAPATPAASAPAAAPAPATPASADFAPAAPAPSTSAPAIDTPAASGRRAPAYGAPKPAAPAPRAPVGAINEDAREVAEAYATPGAAAARAAAAGAAAAPPSSRAQIAPQETLWQAAETGDLATLRRLLDAHADVDGRDAQGRTALMRAVLYNQAPAVELLLGAGASPNAADHDGLTPLQAAEARGEHAIVEALQRGGAR